MFEIIKENNRFFIEEDELVGEIKFIIEDDNILVTKTYVNPNYRGKSIARILVDSVVEFARNENKKIVPICSYVLSTFEKNPIYLDVWNKEYNYDPMCEL